MKPFSTHRQQLSILRNRGLTIKNGSQAMRILERENYYNVVNGYKDLFLEKDHKGSPLKPEQYIKGTQFKEIYTLFLLDRELRNILLKYLLIFENSIKTKIAYHFSKKYKKPHAYLQMENYTNDPSQLQRVLGLIATISNQISKKSQTNRDTPIKHYLDNHEGVPLWVMVNYLTLGNISNFYSSLDKQLQDEIAKDFSKQYKKQYKVKNHLQIPAQSIIEVLKIANLFRNVCAHEERLYNFKLDKNPKIKHISKVLQIPIGYLKGNLFTMVSFLKLTLTKKEYKELISSLDKLFSKYNASFTTVQFSAILKEMGFPNE